MVFDGNRFVHYEAALIKERKLMASQGIVFLSIKAAKKFIFVSSHGLVEGVPEEFNKRIRDGVRKMLVNNADSMKNHNIREAKVTDYVKTIVRHMYNKTPEVKIHWLQDTKDD